MEHTEAQPAAPVDAIRLRVKELRRRDGITAAELAERLAEYGVPWNRSIVANFEGGRRPTLSVVEWLALAAALNVAPVHLLIPPDVEPNEPYQVTPSRTVQVAEARQWVRGHDPLPGAEPREFFGTVPLEEAGRRWAPLTREAYDELLKLYPLRSSAPEDGGADG